MSGVWYRGAARLPAEIALAIIPSLPRAHLEKLAQQIIDHLDDEEGDPDLEDAHNAEDDFTVTEGALYWAADGPGCLISDPYGVHDEDGANMPSAYIPAIERAEDCPLDDHEGCAVERSMMIGATP